MILVFSGCDLSDKIMPKPLKSDSKLPKVTNIKTIPDTTAIAFEWKPLSNNLNIEGYRIYRKELNLRAGQIDKLALVAKIKNRVSSHYVDSDLEPNHYYIYKFTVYTKDHHESKPSKEIRIKTLKVIKPLHYVLPVNNLANMGKLIWRPHTDPRVAGYIIERKKLYSNEWKEVGELHHRLNVEFIDRDLKTNKAYQYRVRVKTFEGLISKPSKEVEIITKARPKPIIDITATKELAREIKLTWRKSKETDIIKYRIYRSEENDGDFKVIGFTLQNSYSDKILEDGKQMFYKITAIDNTGLESILNNIPIMGSTLIKPNPPQIYEISKTLKKDKIGVLLKWRPTDPRTLKYKIIRISGMLLRKQTKVVAKEIQKTSLIDFDVGPGITYIYQVFAIDRFNIFSKPSEDIEILLDNQ
jgi:fibronectin type 3 domain-containing protein